MIYSKRLLQMAHKWQKHAIKQRRRISFEKRTPNRRGGLLADEGHFVVYTIDGSRFMIPLAYLNHLIFQELLSMAEEEFGFTICGPLQVPCVASVMDYIVSLLSKNACVDKEKAMVSITSCIKPLSSLGLHRIISANKILCGF
ncbi:auxin-responsive protein SAUR68-like [Amborella trichopoda]|uniref:auxin-responsive protein SAUR68-like n=1 Tax=Amborella trichopoda TaxID=13333 RepID=UPI0005D32532|nr:auxin-responsive protein SAUR68-like [Amborella trichopoda]|eukprot:XP_011621254.1 auxin-responsive protein SAUR68-like [Amborella trichopoda]